MFKLLRAIGHKYFIGKLAQGLVAKVYFGHSLVSLTLIKELQ